MAKTAYTQEQAAAELGISRWTLSRWHSDGKITVGRKMKNRKKYIYTVSDIATIRAWMNETEGPGESRE
jgi:predicted site-specific integrase-resolvase